MQTISVRTTQNVFIHYPLASLGDRILAHLIDGLILVIYAIVLIALIVGTNFRQDWVLFVLFIFPFVFYKVIFEIFMNGQTPGKRAMSIKVVRIDGTPATLGGYIIRWLTSLVEYSVGSGLIPVLMIAAGGKGQRLGDLFAGTTVVKLIEQKQATAQEVFISPENNYQATFGQVIQLNPSDIELIQRALEINRDHGNDKPMLAVTEKIKSQLGLQTDLPPIRFLYMVVKDYNHLTSRSSI
jgi:uncharacterized RDD family membrane protein YckC